MRIINKTFIVIAILLSDIMCATVGINYVRMLYRIKYEGYSAPAYVAFLWAIPFLIGIAVCLGATRFLSKRTGNEVN